MGRKKSLVKPPLRTAVVQFRCTQEFKDALEEIAEAGSYPDLTAMFEAMVIREAKRLKRKEPLPPR